MAILFENHKWYAVEGRSLNAIVQVAHRLYAERSLDADGMRDLAQALLEGALAEQVSDPRGFDITEVINDHTA